MKIFSGSSNLSLAKKIAKALDAKLGDIELSQFPNGEARVWIKEDVSNQKCFIIQSFSNPPDRFIIEFTLIADALKRRGAKEIIAVIPWFGYCVQDKVFREGEPLNSKVIAKIVQVSKINQLFTVDLHNETILGFFDIPAEHLKATPIFVDFFKKDGIDLVISPDVGALKNTTKLAHALNLPIAVINKKRDLKTGKVKILGINQQVKGKKVLINDDFVSTGQTLMKTAAFLKKQGVKKVVACLTHHFYVPGVQEKIEKSEIDKIYVTDTIAKPEKKKYKKLNILSIAPLLAQKIKSC
jgi:ribose-phosphate pyrophosphokinase